MIKPSGPRQGAALTTWIIHGTLMSSVPVYALLAWGIGPLRDDPLPGASPVVLAAGLALLSAGNIIVGLLTWKGVLPIGPATVETPGALQTRMIIVDALFEAPAIFAFVYLLLGGSQVAGLLVMAVALGAMAWLIPELDSRLRSLNP